MPEILKDSHRLETDIGSATRLQVLQEALYTLESVSLKFVMEAARSLDLDASTMRDILRYASARSAASIAKDEDDYGSDLTLMRSKLSIFTALTLSLQNSSPSPITAAARSTIYRWENVEISHHSSDAPGSPTVWDFSDKSQYQSHQREKLVIVGLGVMGIGMALSAQKVYDVRGCDSNPERLAEADAQGLPTTPNLTSALIDVDCVLFVVQTTQEIMSILDQASDALTVRRKPLTIIVHSTISSKSAVMIQTRLFNLNKRIQYIEAPVSGGPARAYRGELLVSCTRSDRD